MLQICSAPFRLAERTTALLHIYNNLTQFVPDRKVQNILLSNFLRLLILTLSPVRGDGDELQVKLPPRRSLNRLGSNSSLLAIKSRGYLSF